MDSRGIKNLLLTILVILLGLVTWFSGERKEEESHPPLTAIDPAKVKVIRVSNNNGPEFVLERRDGGWRMTAPYRVAANQPRINILLDLASTPSSEQQPLPLDRLAEFSLDRPLATVQFNDTQLIFGGTHPYNYRRYLRIGDTLHLTDDLFPHHFLARAEEFISHQLFPRGQKIREIKTVGWHLFRSTDRAWQLDPPQPALSADRLVEKVDQWQNTWVARIELPPKVTPTSEVQVWFEEQPKPITLGVVEEKKGTLLVSAELGLAYRLPATNDLLQLPAVE